jgi:hypothetical protein
MTLRDAMIKWLNGDPQVELILAYVLHVCDNEDEVANERDTPYDKARLLVWRMLREGNRRDWIRNAAMHERVA